MTDIHMGDIGEETHEVEYEPLISAWEAAQAHAIRHGHGEAS